MASSINWNDVSKKEARGSNNIDLGEIQEVLSDSVIIQKGLIDKETYKIPKSLVQSFDGKILSIEVSENQVMNFKVDKPQSPTVRDQYLSTTEIDRGGGSGGGIQIEPTADNSPQSSEST